MITKSCAVRYGPCSKASPDGKSAANAVTGHEAVTKAERLTSDIVILDIGVPDLQIAPAAV